MKKLIALMLVASLTGAVIAQQAAPQQTAPARTNQTGPSTATGKTAPMDEKDKKHHHRHHHRHHEKPAQATK